jgi:hypothetical protein
MKKTIALSFIIIAAFALQSAFALAADQFANLSITKATITAPALVKKNLSNLLAKDDHIKTADGYLKKTFGLTPGDAKGYWGADISAQNTKTKKTLVCQILIQDYVKKGSSDIGMLGQVTVTTPDKKSEVYTFVISSAGGKIENCKEFYVDRVRFTKVVPNTRGWLASVWENFASQCKTAANSLGSCKLTTFSEFIGCLNTAGAGCFQSVLVCSSCGCASNCIGICGCCER